MALTVEELQIVLSCDATTAQRVLEKMDATVKAYTDKFKKYMGGSKAQKRDIEETRQAMSDLHREEYKVGRMLTTEQMASRIAQNCAKATAQTKQYFARSQAEYQKVVNKIADDNQLINLGAKVRGVLEDSTGGVSNISDVMRYQIQQASNQIKTLSAEYARSVASTGENSKGSMAIQKKLEAAIVSAQRYINELDKIAAKEQEIEAENAGSGTESVWSRVVSTLDNAKSRLSGIASSAKVVGARIKKAFDNTLLGKFLKRLGTVMLRMAAMRLINGVINGITKGLQELAKHSASSAKAMNTFKAAGGSIKMALGTAVMPIVKALAPLFVRLASAISSACNAIARFFAIITGQSTYTAVNFSDSLDDVASSAGGAGKAVKGMLADWDELTVIGKQSGGGGGGGSNGVESSMSTVKDLLANSILGEMFNNEQFFEIGQTISRGLNGLLTKFDEWIDSIRDLDLGRKAAELINGFFAPDEFGRYVTFEKAGEVVANAFVTVVETLARFIATIDWSDIVGALKGFVKGFKDRIDEAFLENFSDGSGNVKPYWEIVSDWIKEQLRPSSVLQEGDSELVWQVRRFVSDLIDSFQNFSLEDLDISEGVSSWVKQIRQEFQKAIGIEDSNGESSIFSLFFGGDLDFWGDVSASLFDFDDKFNSWWDRFSLSWEKLKVTFQKFFNDLKVVLLQDWGDFLEKLNDPMLIKALSLIGIDLPEAIQKNKTALNEAQQDATVLDIKYGALSKTLEEAKNEANGTTTALNNLNGTESTASVTVNADLDYEDDGAGIMSSLFHKGAGGNGAHVLNKLPELRLPIVLETQNESAAIAAVTKAITEITAITSAVASLPKNKVSNIAVNLKGTKPTTFTTVSNAISGINSKYATVNVTKTGAETKDLTETKNAITGLPKSKKIPISIPYSGLKTALFSVLLNMFNALHSKTVTLTILRLGVSDQSIIDTANAFSKLKSVTVKITASLSTTSAVTTFVNNWAKLSNKALSLSVSLNDSTRSAWNKAASAWNSNSITSRLGRLPTLAHGGLAYGTTTAIIGEYSGASANPEVVAPLSDLLEIMTKAGANMGGGASDEELRLLREQNSLLRTIANKEWELHPSVGLGQVVERSRQLYART